MKTSNLFSKCVSLIGELLLNRKLCTKHPYSCPVHQYFSNAWHPKVSSGIVVSSVEGESGLITRAWGIVFADPERPVRCTNIHSSFYGESVALCKLLDELESIKYV